MNFPSGILKEKRIPVAFAKQIDGDKIIESKIILGGSWNTKNFVLTTT
jgi:hypothetical protein